MRLTDRDELIVEWVSLVPGSTYEHLAAATGSTVDSLRHRLPQLSAAGLLRRELLRCGHRSTALWYPAPDNRSTHHTVAPAAPTEPADHCAPLRAAALLPHFQPRRPDMAIHQGTTLTNVIQRRTFAVQLREPASRPVEDFTLHPLPEFLLDDGPRLLAIELRFGPGTENWTQRLATYRRLGVPHVEVHTDQPLLAHILGRLAACTDTPLVQIRVWRASELDQSA